MEAKAASCSKRNASCSTDGARARGALQQHAHAHCIQHCKITFTLESAIYIENSCQLYDSLPLANYLLYFAIYTLW